MGFLPGDLALFPKLRGIETLQLFASLQERQPTARDGILHALGFPMPALERRVSTYSTGMRQMIGVAVAMQHDPELLVLDEPTSGLDPLVRDALLDLLRKARERGTTVFLSSHVLAEVEACADRVALIDQGRLRLEGSVEDLRQARPRQVLLTYSDGRRERLTQSGPPAELLQGLALEDLADIEIRPPSLDEVMRSVLNRREER